MKVTIAELEWQVASGKRPQRAGQLERAKKILVQHPEATLIECGDENTGRRFGRALKRKGRCEKIGQCGWSPRSRQRAYQLWATWAEEI